MIKGVNKQIIEVKNPDSVYFEKVVFYLKSGVNILPDEISGNEIDRYIKSNDRTKKKIYFKDIALFILSAFSVISALLTIMFRL